jgi:hypothetical protein
MCGEGCHCGCGEGSRRHGHHDRFTRRFQTRDEQIAELEGYLTDLKAEARAVEERLADLRRAA